MSIKNFVMGILNKTLYVYCFLEVLDSAPHHIDNATLARNNNTDKLYLELSRWGQARDLHQAQDRKDPTLFVKDWIFGVGLNNSNVK